MTALLDRPLMEYVFVLRDPTVKEVVFLSGPSWTAHFVLILTNHCISVRFLDVPVEDWHRYNLYRVHPAGKAA